jgi:hypothetical protein
MPYRRRLPVRLSPYQGEVPRTGHNRGPALDLSWEAWLWRRAHAQAWKPPRRDIALHRLKRAERLGLDYRSYAGVLMNRGTHLGAAIFVLDGLSERERRHAEERILGLSDCRILIASETQENTSLKKRVDLSVEFDGENDLVRHIDRFILAHRLTPSGTFMVGTTSAHLRAAEDAGLALFLWAKDYFNRPVN